jgi:Cu2+-exporting ATPase
LTAAPALGCPNGAVAAEIEAFGHNPTAFVKRTGDRSSLDILVRGARCGACLSRIETAVRSLPSVTIARLNLSTGQMRVEWTGGLAAPQVVAAIANLGYSAAAFDPDTADKDREASERRLLVALAVAGFAAANVMLLSVSVWAGGRDMPVETERLLHWISALIAIPAAAFAGQPFFESAIASIRARRLNMDVPISLAVVLAVGMSLYETVRGGSQAYFDAAVTLLFFLLIGRFLDARLRRRAYAAANAMAALKSASVTRILASGEAREVRASEVAIGDLLTIAPGERLVVDAEVVLGESDVDLRLVTGEVEPVAAFSGQVLHAGVVNLTSALQVRARATADTSLTADMARMLEAGEQKKSSYRKFADRAAEAYVPRVHGLALLGFIGWLIAGSGIEHAIFIAITVLIITCPCAMALAAPVVQVVAAGRLFREQCYLASGDALERIAEIDHVVFDKTGTLTLGDPVLLPGTARSEDIEAAAQLARASRHPFSRAIAAAAGPGPIAGQVREEAGRGVSGMLDGVPARLGSALFVGVDCPASGSHLWFRRGDAPAIGFRFADVLRPDARQTIERLSAMGVSAEILSGDTPERVSAIAKQLGLSHWTAHATPQSKTQRLLDLRKTGRRVLMVGDGLNDAGALANAHASLAPGGALDVSRLASDCVFAGDSLDAVIRILDVARTATRRMKENFRFAFVYNVVAVPIALAGLVTPMIAAIAMSSSSIIVTLNALRLNAHKHRPSQAKVNP